MRITGLRVTPLSLPFRVPYHWAGRVDHGANIVLVEIATDEGITGIGESTAGAPASAIAAMLRAQSSTFVGQSPYDIEMLLARSRYLGSFNLTPRFANLCLAGIEMALWDIIGKAAGQPVHRLLGGQVRPYVDYFGFLQGDTTEELVEDARRVTAAGYSVIYLKVGRGEHADLQNVAAVRDVIGDRRLRLDANEAWDPATAIRMIRALERFEPEFVEQPTPCQSITALRQVKESVRVPIAIDQAVFTPADVFEVCRQRAADVIVLSIHEVGGILALKKAAAIAEAAGMSICLHGQSVSSITDSAQHQAGLAIANLTDGNQIMHQLLARDLVLAPDLTPKDGRIGPLNAPGLGIELDQDAVQALAARN